MQTNPAAEQSKIIRWSESSWNQSARKEKGLWRKRCAKEPSLEFRMKYSESKRRCFACICCKARDAATENNLYVNPHHMFNQILSGISSNNADYERMQNQANTDKNTYENRHRQNPLNKFLQQ